MRRFTLCLGLVCLLTCALSHPACAALYQGVDLFTFSYPTPATGITVGSYHAGQYAGSLQIANQAQAVIWDAATGVPTNLHPTKFGAIDLSLTQGIDGARQVGSYYVNNTPRAVMWSGSAASATSLHPTNLSGFNQSFGRGVRGAQFVGSGRGSATGNKDHALLWNGTANSAVDLHPTNLAGFTESIAWATDGNYQVGHALKGSNYHAMMWHGASNTAIDLHPTAMPNVVNSYATGVAGGQQIGWAQISNGPPIALLWSGTAASAAQSLHGTVRFTNGTQQVGGDQAFLSDWPGNTVINLHEFLPEGLGSSYALSIDDDGVIYGIAFSAFNGEQHAVKWVPVPEPSPAALATWGLVVAFSFQRLFCKSS